MRRLLVVLVVLLASCGDDRLVPETFAPASGTRLKLEQYQYDDGARQPEPDAFYDVRLHARCTPQPWIDGALRCVPDADPAVYTDAECMLAVGLAVTIDRPTHFIGFLGGDRERIWATGADTDPIEQYYVRSGEDVCAGPFAVPLPQDPEDEIETFELANEIGGEELVPFTEREVGDGRLGLVLRETDDGVRVPLRLVDRELAETCTPSADGTCQPAEAIAARDFADPACTEPLAIVPEGVPVPRMASVASTAACSATYHRLGGPVSTRYRRSGDRCVPVATGPMQRLFGLGPALELATFDRVIGDGARRLEPIAAAIAPGIELVDAERMFDSATRTECTRVDVGERLRCLPAALAPAVALHRAGCTVPLRIAQVPVEACEIYAFAVYPGDGLEVHAIGAPFTGTAWVESFGTCTPYAPPAGVVLHEVGPVLPPETFVGAVAFGAR